MEFSEKIWRSILDEAPCIVLVVDDQHVIQFINYTVPGISQEEVIGRSQFDFIDPEHHQAVRETNERVFRSGTTESYEIRGTGPHGQAAWYSSTTQPVHINGQTVALAIFTFDVTEKKKAEQDLEKSTSRYDGLTRNMPGMIYRGGPDWSIDIMQGCETLSGFTPEEISSMEEKWIGVIHPDDKETVVQEGSSILGGPTSLVQLYRILTKDGSTRWVEDRKTSFFDKDGNFAGVDGILLDVTDRVNTEKSLRKAKDELIHRQSEAIRELSTPVIQVWDNILVLPLIGTIDTNRAKQLIEHLLQAISDRKAEVVIIDITGVPVVDTKVAASIMSATRAARMLGAECVVTGMNPYVAQTLIKSGVSFGDIKAKGNLQDGLQFAFRVTGRSVHDSDR